MHTVVEPNITHKSTIRVPAVLGIKETRETSLSGGEVWRQMSVTNYRNLNVFAWQLW